MYAYRHRNLVQNRCVTPYKKYVQNLERHLVSTSPNLLEILLTSPESGFAIPVVEDPGSHNSAWKYTFA